MIGSQLSQLGVGSPVSGIQLVSEHGPVRLGEYLGRKNVILYWGRTFASSRFWLGAMILRRYSSVLERCGAAVLIIGDEARLGPATRLAAALGLPFLVLADGKGNLQKQFHHEGSGRSVVSLTILVDLQGNPRFIHLGSLPTDVVDGAGLLGAVRSLSTLPCAGCSIPDYATSTFNGRHVS